jgi:hypothetical protein
MACLQALPGALHTARDFEAGMQAVFQVASTWQLELM